MSKKLISEIELLLNAGDSDDFFSKVSELFLKENRFVLKDVNELEGKCFVVEDYQRGYKWTQEQVEQLLNDIAEHNPDDGFYCLQPIVVKRFKEDDGKLKWEVIDGQQRLTTIFLILRYLEGSKPFYCIDYRTRQSSGEFLKLENLAEVVKKVQRWAELIGNDQSYNNSDVYHFFKALKAIQ